jgi:hypothetical protein
MPKIVALASLYEPLEFIETRIKNFNECNMDDVLVWFLDVSPDETYQKAKNIVLKNAEFDYKFSHHGKRETLYWAWNWMIKQSKKDGVWPKYFCNTNVDDVNHPDYFNLMSKYLDENLEKYITCCNWYNLNIKGVHNWDKIVKTHPSEVNPKLTLGHFPMWRSKLHDKTDVGYFNRKMVVIGDADFWSRIKNTCGEKAVGKLNKYLGGYLSHENNLYYKGQGPNGVSGEAWDRHIMKEVDAEKSKVANKKKRRKR